MNFPESILNIQGYGPRPHLNKKQQVELSHLNLIFFQKKAYLSGDSKSQL
nr:hypothetical protein [Mucilaginibacter sp. X4EP1]